MIREHVSMRIPVFIARLNSLAWGLIVAHTALLNANFPSRMNRGRARGKGGKMAKTDQNAKPGFNSQGEKMGTTVNRRGENIMLSFLESGRI